MSQTLEGMKILLADYIEIPEILIKINWLETTYPLFRKPVTKIHSEWVTLRPTKVIIESPESRTYCATFDSPRDCWTTKVKIRFENLTVSQGLDLSLKPGDTVNQSYTLKVGGSP